MPEIILIKISFLSKERSRKSKKIVKGGGPPPYIFLPLNNVADIIINVIRLFEETMNSSRILLFLTRQWVFLSTKEWFPLPSLNIEFLMLPSCNNLLNEMFFLGELSKIISVFPAWFRWWLSSQGNKIVRFTNFFPEPITKLPLKNLM